MQTPLSRPKELVSRFSLISSVMLLVLGSGGSPVGLSPSRFLALQNAALASGRDSAAELSRANRELVLGAGEAAAVRAALKNAGVAFSDLAVAAPKSIDRISQYFDPFPHYKKVMGTSDEDRRYLTVELNTNSALKHSSNFLMNEFAAKEGEAGYKRNALMHTSYLRVEGNGVVYETGRKRYLPSGASSERIYFKGSYAYLAPVGKFDVGTAVTGHVKDATEKGTTSTTLRAIYPSVTVPAQNVSGQWCPAVKIGEVIEIENIQTFCTDATCSVKTRSGTRMWLAKGFGVIRKEETPVYTISDASTPALAFDKDYWLRSVCDKNTSRCSCLSTVVEQLPGLAPEIPGTQKLDHSALNQLVFEKVVASFDGNFPGAIVMKQRNRKNTAPFKVAFPSVTAQKVFAHVTRKHRLIGPLLDLTSTLQATPTTSTVDINLPVGIDLGVSLYFMDEGEGGYHLKAYAEAAEAVVGDIFLTAGQSNTTNAGEGKTTSHESATFAFDGAQWVLAEDPLPLADGTTGSSPWPTFGDLYYNLRNVPVGIVSLGKAGTPLAKWQPDDRSGLNLYARLRDYVNRFGANGFKAILWHQGEADVWDANVTERGYQDKLLNLIRSLRLETSVYMPWFVSTASYPGGTSVQAQICGPDNTNADCTKLIATRMQAITRGQKAVIDDADWIHMGPNTDTLSGKHYRADQNDSFVHFTESGQQFLAWAWVRAVLAQP